MEEASFWLCSRWGGVVDWFWQQSLAFDEDLERRAAIHVAALMGPGLVVADKEGVQIGLHLRQILVEGPAPLDTQMLIEQRSMEALQEAVALRTGHLCRAILDLLQLEEQLVGMLFGRSHLLLCGVLRCPL